MFSEDLLVGKGRPNDTHALHDAHSWSHEGPSKHYAGSFASEGSYGVDLQAKTSTQTVVESREDHLGVAAPDGSYGVDLPAKTSTWTIGCANTKSWEDDPGERGSDRLRGITPWG